MQLSLKAYGENGILVHDLAENARNRLCSAVGRQLPEGCLEYVEGDNTLLFLFKQPTPLRELEKWLEGVDQSAMTRRPRARIAKVPVLYDGPDLKYVAQQTGLSEDEVVERHSSVTYTVRMSGFTPGFPYLDGLDERLHLPRRDVPRQRVAPGSVAIGGSHAGIYSVESPGGWHLLGRTNLQLFHPALALGNAPDSRAVFRFVPGDQLRFQALG